MQPISEIEKSYENPDPWGYKTNPDDIYRRRVIRFAAMMHISHDKAFFERALDIGAGEGWITEYLPAFERHGFEVSEQAASRFPEGVVRAKPPTGKYDLVVGTGIWYRHYDLALFMNLIKEHASDKVLICGVRDWFDSSINHIGKELFRGEFNYYAGTQQLRVFQV